MNFIKEKKSIILLIVIIATTIIITLISLDNYTSDDSSYKDSNSYLHDYGINEVIYTTVNEKDMASKYLVDFVNLVIYDKKEAYNKIDEYYKNNKIKTYDEFENKIKNEYLSIKFLSAKVESYAVKSNGTYKYYYIIDADNNKLVFKEKSIMDYTVYLDTYTVDNK